jgi:hypothetical protein
MRSRPRPLPDKSSFAAPRPVEEARGGHAAGDYTVSAGRRSLGSSKTPTVGGMPSTKCREARRQSLWGQARLPELDGPRYNGTAKGPRGASRFRLSTQGKLTRMRAPTFCVRLALG